MERITLKEISDFLGSLDLNIWDLRWNISVDLDIDNMVTMEIHATLYPYASPDQIGAAISLQIFPNDDKTTDIIVHAYPLNDMGIHFNAVFQSVWFNELYAWLETSHYHGEQYVCCDLLQRMERDMLMTNGVSNAKSA